MADSILEINNLSIAFAAGSHYTKAVDQLSFTIQTGQCISLVGESGSGKSLTALASMQLLPQAARVHRDSQIIYAGSNLLHFTEQQMRHIRGPMIGMIFQDAMSALNPVLTIGHQIAEVLKMHHVVPKRQIMQRTLVLLEEVGIDDPSHCYRSYPHQLSGGMRQRAMIAIALSCQPKILIADEPTTALDVTLQAQILSLLKKLVEKHQMTLIFISHNLAVVSQLADEIIVLKKGKKVEHATTEQFFITPQHEYSRQLLEAIPSRQAKTPQTTTEHPLLEVKQLKVHFPIRSGLLKRHVGSVKAVDGIDFTLMAGQTMALVGESGSGKTTTGKAILKLIQSTSGTINFDGNNLLRLSKKKMGLLRQHIQFIFQDPFASLNPRMLVLDSIAEGLYAQKKVHRQKEAINIIDRLLTQVNLPLDAKWRYPHEFSGGEKQRICIARALALKPKLLILDEPTSALDVSIQMQILKLLEDLQEQHQLTYLLITHDLSIVAYLAQTMAVMQQGNIVESGQTADILTSPQHAYTKRLLASIPLLKTTSTEEDQHDTK